MTLLPALVTPFLTISPTNEEATGAINNATIGAIHLLAFYLMCYCFSSSF